MKNKLSAKGLIPIFSGLLPLAIILLLFAGRINAQTVSASYNGAEITLTKDSCAQILLFTGKYYEGKTYLHWDVKDRQCDGLYIIYSSRDDEKYELLGHKNGIGVPVAFLIAYYFQDEHPLEGITYYRFVHISKDKTYLVSEKVKVTIDRTILTSSK